MGFSEKARMIGKGYRSNWYEITPMNVSEHMSSLKDLLRTEVGGYKGEALKAICVFERAYKELDGRSDFSDYLCMDGRRIEGAFSAVESIFKGDDYYENELHFLMCFHICKESGFFII